MDRFLSAVSLVTVIGCAEQNTKKHSLVDSGLGAATPDHETEYGDLSAFRQIRQTQLTEAHTPTSIALDPRYGIVLSLDAAAERVWTTDALFLHDPRTVCIDNSSVRNSAPPAPNGTCPSGMDKTARGALHTPQPPVAVAIQEGGGTAGILTASGQLYWVSTDPIATQAHDHMRPLRGPLLDVETGPETKLSITPSQIAVATFSTLHIFDHGGERVETIEAEGTITDIMHHESAWWVLTSDDALRQQEVAGSGGMRFLQDGPNAWVLSADALTPITASADAIEISNALGPAVVWGDQIIALTREGVIAISDGVSEPIWSEEVIDLQVNEAQELVILQPQGLLRVFVNESAYSSSTKLHAWISTFIELPRNPNTVVPCRGAGETIESILARAHRNMELLRNLPAPIALGVTPSHWTRAGECDAAEQLRSLVEPHDLGALFHHAPEQCNGDQACYQDALAADLSAFTIPPSWVSGLGAHTELNIDWVQALQHIDAPDRFSFFGLSLRPDIPHSSDIRAKDSWPSTVTGHTRSWTTDTVENILDGSQTGWLHLLPGDNVPAFNLGGCANLFLNECHPLGRGSGGELGPLDIQSLDLLLHRALVSAQSGDLHTWNFHLPDIGVYDYTEECEENDGAWSGEECEGARLQAWLNDADQRFAERGLLEWSTPGTLVLP